MRCRRGKHVVAATHGQDDSVEHAVAVAAAVSRWLITGEPCRRYVEQLRTHGPSFAGGADEFDVVAAHHVPRDGLGSGGARCAFPPLQRTDDYSFPAALVEDLGRGQVECLDPQRPVWCFDAVAGNDVAALTDRVEFVPGASVATDGLFSSMLQWLPRPSSQPGRSYLSSPPGAPYGVSSPLKPQRADRRGRSPPQSLNRRPQRCGGLAE
jgi:hypothetical protein